MNSPLQRIKSFPGASSSELEALKSRVLKACAEFERVVSYGDKDEIRTLHLLARNDSKSNTITNKLPILYEKYKDYFIDGKNLDPSKIDPILIPIDDPNNKWADIFKIVRHTWSMPYSKGYGRRLRFIVFDSYHEAVIGVLGFQSPPADLACRDSLFKFQPKQKLNMINRTMDVYTIGAIPPYSNLLGGKLVAGLVSSNEVRQAYWRRYANKKTEINNTRIQQPLVAATTTSVFGRSSIYNRLKMNGSFLAKPIGYTKGCGMIHLEKIYPEIKELLYKVNGEFISGGYGNGPKIRWQNMTKALKILDLKGDCMLHGLKREVFLFNFVSDLKTGMEGGSFGTTLDLTADEYAQYWKERWCQPRSIRVNDWKKFTAREYFSSSLGLKL